VPDWEERWLELVADALDRRSGRSPDAEVALLLTATFSATGTFLGTATGHAAPQLRVWPARPFAGAVMDEILDFSAHRSADEHPLVRFYRTTGAEVVQQVADVPEPIAGPRTHARWREVSVPWGVPDELGLPITLGPVHQRAFVVAREGAFTSDEIALARRLQRLLVGLHRQLDVLGTWDAESGAPAVDDLALTARQLAVLVLLAEGLTAAAIARRLLITERTVHKHLEHLYRRLGATDRVTAVRRAQQLGLLGPAP
jgi:DNA-binding CsgD family transcriptional regulator